MITNIFYMTKSSVLCPSCYQALCQPKISIAIKAIKAITTIQHTLVTVTLYTKAVHTSFLWEQWFVLTMLTVFIYLMIAQHADD